MSHDFNRSSINFEGDMPYTTYSFSKNNFQHVKMTISEFEGQLVFDLRLYGEKPDGTVYPTRNGLRLAASHLPEADNAVRAAIRDLGLDDTPTARPAKFSVRRLVSSVGQRMRNAGAGPMHRRNRQAESLDAYETTGFSPPADATGDGNA